MKTELRRFNTYAVGLTASPDVLQLRDGFRTDRSRGSASAQFRQTQSERGHDMTIDTSRMTPRDAAKQIIEGLHLTH